MPLALLVLTVLLRNFSIDRLSLRDVAIGAVVIVSFQIAVRFDVAAFFLALSLLQWGLCLAAVICGVSIDRARGGPIAGVALIAFASTELINLHVDYATWQLGLVPAGLIVMVTHCLLASIVFASTLGLARLLRSTSRVASLRAAVSMPAAGALAMMVLIELSYFQLNAFTHGMRFFVIAVLFLAVMAFPLRIGRGLFGRRRLVQVAAVAAITLGAIQFVSFAVDYQTRYRVFRSGQAEGNVRAAWEPLVEWARPGPCRPFIWLNRFLLSHWTRRICGST